MAAASCTIPPRAECINENKKVTKVYPLLDLVDSPEDLKKIPKEDLPSLVREIREFMVDSVSKTGGHLSSSLGAVELAVALHSVFDSPKDQIIWDVGHQAYAHKILTGRKSRMNVLRQYKGISGFPKRSESMHDAFGTAHSSTSISAALGMAVADKLKGRSDRWHIAVIGDGALTGGMAIEALNDAGVYKEGCRLLIILNDNDCSISPPAGALSKHLARIVSTQAYNGARELSKAILKPIPKLWDVAKRMEKNAINFVSPPAAIFSAFDLNYYGPVDGHDVEELIRVLENLKKLDNPMVLHIVTKKGKGYARAEADPTAYHGVSKFDPDVGLEKTSSPAPTYTKVFGDWICAAAERDPSVYAITPAMREGSGLVEYEKRFPTRYRDVAIAEQHAVTYAAGLACDGVHPVVAIYSTFLQRAYDQVVHDVALQNLPVLFAVDRGGLVGADGATHHGVFDLAMLRSIPNMVVAAPSDESEQVKLLNTGLKYNGPFAVRYPRGCGVGAEAHDSDSEVEIGRARVLRKGSRVAFLGFGTMVNVLAPIAEKLDATLIDMRFVKPIDKEAILEAASKHSLLVAAEEGVLMGGACSAAAEVLLDAGVMVPFMRFGIPDRFIDQGTQQQLWDEIGLTTEKIEANVLEKMSEIGF